MATPKASLQSIIKELSYFIENIVIDEITPSESISVNPWGKVPFAISPIDETQILIIIGYGFGDYGINQAFWNWLSNNESAKMFIIDIYDTLDNFAENKHRPNLFHHYNSVKRGEKLLYFNGGVENADYEQIFARINEIIGED